MDKELNRHGIANIMLFIIALVSIGSASILVRLSNASPYSCAFWRLFLASVFLYISSIITKNRLNLRELTERTTPLVIFSGICLGLHFVTWMDSLFRVPIAVSTTIVVAYPIHLMMIESVLEKEYPKIREIIGISIAYIGILMFFGGTVITRDIDIIGVVESFIASIFAAIYFYIGRIIRKRIDIYSYTIPTYITGSLIAIIYGFTVNDNVFLYIYNSWLWLLLLALIPMIGGHTIMNYLLKFYKSSRVSSIALGEPIVATLLSIPILGEIPSPHLILPMILTLSGIGIVLLYQE
ncbi:protein of unknown function DUF6 transmembrane [Ignisphaera aggregans DSM 17230]|uniref:EamA domain-containing protein n=1 Tax=Ignisphaera aggregans (strain DSM 17230 / JCM 13409 / AQ1.S1) TaxID=583356 RepID=E0SQN1_IGNAA|nr:protein of unknown function DUF6 transmembrane [Ignisphaera aggregans DSM 17230]